MKLIIIINIIAIDLILIYLLFRYLSTKFYFHISKTIWMKIPYSVTIMYVTHENEYSRSAKGIYTFSWRNYKKVTDLDSKLFYEKRQPK